jgi:hypothetical protein
MTTLTPDLEEFHAALVHSLDLQRYGPADVIRDFRALFLRDEALGRRVLFLLLTWCGEYDVSDGDVPVPPIDPNELQRWAGKREVAAKLKAALYADLSTTTEDLTNV